MDKKELGLRLENLELMKANHDQDVRELTFVIEGLKEQIKTAPEAPVEEEKIEEAPKGVR